MIKSVGAEDVLVDRRGDLGDIWIKRKETKWGMVKREFSNIGEWGKDN